MSCKQQNIVFWWDNLGWGERGCYGNGVLRGLRAAQAPEPSISAAGLTG